MAKITQRATVSVEATFTCNEEECRALDALVGYNFDSFVETFKENLGSHYMEGHEDGLKEFFETIRQMMPGILARADTARKAFEKNER